MFSSLKLLTEAAPAPVAPAKVELNLGVSMHAFRAAHKHRQINARITASRAKAQSVTNDFADLRRLRNVAFTQGLSKALMLFANPNNNVISRIAKNIPSNESLDAVSIGRADRRTKQALEGMDESLSSEPKLIADWTHGSADDVDQLLSSIDDQLKDVGQAISHFLQVLENSDGSDDDLTVMVEAVPYASAAARFDALLEILPDLDAMVSDPTDRDSMDAYKDKISALVTKLSDAAGIAVDPENPHLLIPGTTSSEYVASQATLADLGYTTANTIELLKKADQVVDEVNGLIERKEAIVSHFHQTADNISLIDNTVPPAVDGAIEEDDEDDTTPAPDGLTQADVYHCQVSSHLYALATVVGVAIEAVQEVLIVANELSDDEDGDVADDVVVIIDSTESADPKPAVTAEPEVVVDPPAAVESVVVDPPAADPVVENVTPPADPVDQPAAVTE